MAYRHNNRLASQIDFEVKGPSSIRLLIDTRLRQVSYACRHTQTTSVRHNAVAAGPAAPIYRTDRPPSRRPTVETQRRLMETSPDAIRTHLRRRLLQPPPPPPPSLPVRVRDVRQQQQPSPRRQSVGRKHTHTHSCLRIRREKEQQFQQLRPFLYRSSGDKLAARRELRTAALRVYR